MAPANAPRRPPSRKRAHDTRPAARQHGRASRAAHPAPPTTQPPPRAAATTRALWRAARGRPLRELAGELWTKLRADEVATRAGGLAFFTLLSVIPVLLIVAQLLGAVDPAGADLGRDAVASLDSLAPRSVVALLMRTLGNIDRGAVPGGALSIGAAVALWSGSRGVRAAVRAIDLAYGASPRTGTWRANAMGVLLTVALATLVVAALLLMFHGNEVGEALAARVGAGDAFARAWPLVQWSVVLAFVLAGAEIVYRYAPGRDPVQWRIATPGGVVFLVLWLVASLLMRAYFRTFADLGFAYGPLGAVVMLMLWLYLSSAALIVGGEVNAALRGPPAPRGAR